MKKYTLNSTERIKHRKIIENIFSIGETVYNGNIRINFIKTTFSDNAIAKVGFFVPKKKFKRAYKRNKLKRMMREVYRLNKPEFYDILTKKNIKIALLFVYLGNEIVDYNNIEKDILSALNKMIKKI